jgi:hypothetical protein
MNALIEQVLLAAGEMPDPEAHRRYLARLSEQELRERLAALKTKPAKHADGVPEIRFWTRAVALAVKDDQLQTMLGL